MADWRYETALRLYKDLKDPNLCSCAKLRKGADGTCIKCATNIILDAFLKVQMAEDKKWMNGNTD